MSKIDLKTQLKMAAAEMVAKEQEHGVFDEELDEVKEEEIKKELEEQAERYEGERKTGPRRKGKFKRYAPKAERDEMTDRHLMEDYPEEGAWIIAKFDRNNFANSLYSYFKYNKKLSPKQVSAVANIIKEDRLKKRR